MWTYKINPFEMMLEILHEHYPDFGAEIFFVPPEALVNEGEGDKPCWGLTAANRNDGMVIYINHEIPACHSVEIIAHEAAHIIAGFDQEHNEQWEAIFSRLHELYEEKYEHVIQAMC